MQISIPYGKTALTAAIPGHIPVDIIEAPETHAAADPLATVRAALDNLLGGITWDMLKNTRHPSPPHASDNPHSALRNPQFPRVAIAVNDKTRPVPHQHLLPPLLDRLAALGIPDAAITFYIAVGTHPPMTPDEFPSILPAEILKRYRVVSHDSENENLLVNLGNTPAGTPIWTNKDYYRSDFKIVVGNIEPHQFVGFSGGVKTAAVGLAGLKTINVNHALMTHPASKLGEYETNPARQDVEEIGKKIQIHLALNAILSQQKEIVHALAGSPRAVMEAGLALSRKACQVAVDSKYSLVISSPGGHPKDINLYQAQKGLGHAALITRPGGTIILVASCSEGTGSPHYEEWMPGKKTYDEIFTHFAAEGFRIGPHKAYQIARDASKVRFMFVSQMPESQARALLLNPVPDLQTALDIALPDLFPGERIGILPHAASTIPFLRHESR